MERRHNSHLRTLMYHHHRDITAPARRINHALRDCVQGVIQALKDGDKTHRSAEAELIVLRLPQDRIDALIGGSNASF